MKLRIEVHVLFKKRTNNNNHGVRLNRALLCMFAGGYPHLILVFPALIL